MNDKSADDRNIPRTRIVPPKFRKGSRFDKHFPIIAKEQNWITRECCYCNWQYKYTELKFQRPLQRHIKNCEKYILARKNDGKVVNKNSMTTDMDDSEALNDPSNMEGNTSANITDNDMFNSFLKADETSSSSDLNMTEPMDIEISADLQNCEKSKEALFVINKLLTNFISSESDHTKLLTNMSFIEFVKQLNPTYILPTPKEFVEELQPRLIEELYKTLTKDVNEKSFTVCINQILTTSKNLYSVSLSYLEQFEIKQQTIGFMTIDPKDLSNLVELVAQKVDKEYRKYCIVSAIPHISSTFPLNPDIIECSAQSLIKAMQIAMKKLKNTSLPVNYLIDKCCGIMIAFNTEPEIKQFLASNKLDAKTIFDKKIPRNTFIWFAIFELVYSQMDMLKQYSNEKMTYNDVRDYSFEGMELKVFEGIIKLLQPIHILLEQLKSKEMPISNLLKLIVVAERNINKINFDDNTEVQIISNIGGFSNYGGFNEKPKRSNWYNGITFNRLECDSTECLNEVRKTILEGLSQLFEQYLNNKTVQIATFLYHATFNTNFVKQEDWILFRMAVESEMPSTMQPLPEIKVADEFAIYEDDTELSLLEVDIYKTKCIKQRHLNRFEFWETNKNEIPQLYNLAKKYLSIPCSTTFTQNEYACVEECIGKNKELDYLDLIQERNLMFILNQNHY
uniref:Dimer_Tnp_hAT domain-containing protein n=1 Tax=Rhabditophanes sp. KR3021 TaxID=114890 RepID=A0AC35UBQ8_9BILA